MTYKDRTDAGRLLAFHLKNNLADLTSSDLVVIGLPRGGVVVANEIAKELGGSLNVLVVRKIGHPENPEYAAAAVTEHEIFLNPDGKVPAGYIKKMAALLRIDIKLKSGQYRDAASKISLRGKTVILADDGIATGLTMKAAAAEIKSQKPQKMYIAVPVAPAESVQELDGMVDRVFCLYSPMFFAAVGQFYRDFREVHDEEVVAILKQSRR